MIKIIKGNKVHPLKQKFVYIIWPPKQLCYGYQGIFFIKITTVKLIELNDGRVNF